MCQKTVTNYLALPRYLTQSLWASLQGSEPEELRLEKLVRHAARLGLRCPTEPTFAMLLALSFQGARTEQKQRQVLSEDKPRIKRCSEQLLLIQRTIHPWVLSKRCSHQGSRQQIHIFWKHLQVIRRAGLVQPSSGSMLAAPAIPTWEASRIRAKGIGEHWYARC